MEAIELVVRSVENGKVRINRIEIKKSDVCEVIRKGRETQIIVRDNPEQYHIYESKQSYEKILKLLA